MSEMSKEDQEKISRIQMIEQNKQQISSNKQQFQMQQNEIESALNELDKTQKAYKIIGNIMVASKKEDLKRDLEEKKKIVDLRINSLEKQETKLKEKAQKLQKEILENQKN